MGQARLAVRPSAERQVAWPGSSVLIQAQQFLEHGGRRVGAKQRADDRRRKTEDGCAPLYSNGGYQSHGGGS